MERGLPREHFRLDSDLQCRSGHDSPAGFDVWVYVPFGLLHDHGHGGSVDFPSGAAVAHAFRALSFRVWDHDVEVCEQGVRVGLPVKALRKLVLAFSR